ncbi:hypothetical protein BHE74_00051666 [Ensete ventricosum]|nr:hypothetical protein BHE74_00051666 [Ensete ventricosum]
MYDTQFMSNEFAERPLVILLGLWRLREICDVRLVIFTVGGRGAPGGASLEVTHGTRSHGMVGFSWVPPDLLIVRSP